MKTKLTLTGIAVLVLLSLIACSSQASPSVQHLVSCDAFVEQQHISQEVEVAADGSLTVVLCSNPSTGFQWSETAAISDQAVLQQTDHKLVMPESEPPPPPGTPGQQLWVFKALKKGTSTIYMEYSQPWGGGTKAAQIFVLTVIVK